MPTLLLPATADDHGEQANQKFGKLFSANYICTQVCAYKCVLYIYIYICILWFCMQHDPHPRNVRQPGWASDSKPPLFSWSQASLTSSCSKKQFGSNWSCQESEHQMLRVLLVVAPIEAYRLVNIKHTSLRMSQPNWPGPCMAVLGWIT